MYLGATILYMPINLYAGNFRIDFWDIIKMLIMDGTFYHLWYFPAMIIGCIIIIGLCKKCSRGSIVFNGNVCYWTVRGQLLRIYK